MIRLATKNDIDAMVDLGMIYHGQLHVSLKPSYLSVHHTMSSNIQNSFVAEVDGKIVGFFVAAIVPYMWNHDVKVGIELVYFVHDAFRSHGCGLGLLKAMQDHMKESGVKYLIASVAEGDESSIANKLYTAKGFSKMQTSYIKEL